MLMGGLSLMMFYPVGVSSGAIAQSSPSESVVAPMSPTRPILQLGSQGNTVSQLQATLQLLGLYSGEVDGLYQEQTAIAVASFQQMVGLTPDGIMGPDTWSRLLPSVESLPDAMPDAAVAEAPETPTFPEPTVVVPDLEPSSESASDLAVETDPAPVNASEEETAVAQTPFPTPSSLQTPSQTPAEGSPDSTSAGSFDPPAETSGSFDPPAETPGSFDPPAETTPNPSSQAESTTPDSPEQSPTNSEQSVDLPVLRRGMRGSAIERLQERLRSLGFFNGVVDGVFGAETEAAVKAAQEHFSLNPDGIVGPATWTALLR
jgi:peptidoglycan hydrolase-like protein with peptidoglycan-binding domain